MSDIFRDMKLLALTEKTGYSIVQQNGQRKYGPPPGWIGPPPAKGSEIFIGKLPRDVFEHELVPLCEQFGKIYELRLMMDYNGENRGYAFVTYTNNEDASKAIKGLDDFEIRPNRHIGVCKSVDNCRLFIGGIPKDKNKDEIMNEISKFTEGVSKVILYSSILDKTKNRGFAFVEYESHRAAAMARRKLIANSVKLFDHEIAVDWAQPEAQVEDETMRRFLRSAGRALYLHSNVVKVLYVRNLAPATTEEQLHLLFSMGGTLRVERVKKMRDFAFIHYSKREDAENALQQFDGVTVDGCALEVTWAKPPETQKQRSPNEKRDAISSLYRHLNCDNLEHGLDFSLLQNAASGFSMLPRGNIRSRLPLSTFSNLKSPFTITRPIQVLISGFPVQNQKFMSDKVCRTPEEARYYAASYVLKKLSITDIDGPTVSPPSSLTNSNSYANFSKSFASTSNPLGLSKAANASNLGFCSSPKTVPSTKTFKPQMQMPYCFGERGQGDVGNFVPSSQAMDNCSFDDLDNTLLDPNTPIEPNSILGLIASMAAASTNNEIPLYNKPKL